jgi:peroxiredoxin
MVALIKGTKAPAVDLQGLDGKRYNLQISATATGLVVLAFFKVSCPTCQFTMPYLERLHKQHHEANIWGISQDDVGVTASFAKQYGLSFPILIDGDLSSTAKFDLTSVPSIFYIDKNLSIQLTSVGFVRDELDVLNRTIAASANSAVTTLFQSSDSVPAFKPG